MTVIVGSHNHIRKEKGGQRSQGSTCLHLTARALPQVRPRVAPAIPALLLPVPTIGLATVLVNFVLPSHAFVAFL